MRSASDRGVARRARAWRALAVLALIAAGAVPASAVDVAAEYRSERHARGKPVEHGHWRLWRSEERIRREDLVGGVALDWQREGAGVLHRWLFTAERRGVEFQPTDLELLEQRPAWSELGGVLPPGLLERLRPSAVRLRGGVPLRTWSGRLDGTAWRVTLRTDLDLPVEVERRARGIRERLTLVAATRLEAAPWPPPRPEDYDLIDFADLGDREDDPFVRRVTASAGLAHAGHGQP